MTETAFERVVDRLRNDGRQVVEKSGSAQAQCPAHEDRNPSLSLRAMEGSVLVYCHAGCDVDDILAALDLTKADLFDDPGGARYDYWDATSTKVLRTVTRTPQKKFSQSVKVKGTVPLFRLPQVVEAVANGRTIYLVEGEKDVLALESIDVVATTAPMGAGNFAKVDVTPLSKANVVAIVDKDEAGQKWATQVVDTLKPIVASLVFKEAKAGKDAADHVAAGHGIEDLLDSAQVDDADRPPRLWKATDLRGSEQLTWLANRRIPKAAVTILVGDEGIGKSLLWVWIVAAITTGRAILEFGIPARLHPLKVLLVLTEDEWSTTIRPRLELAGADLNQITVICTDDDGSGSPVFPRHMHLVYEAEPDLVILDAFADTVEGRLTLKDPQQARRALHPWKEAATRTGAAILLLTHTNRMPSNKARDKYGLTAELRKKARMTLFAQQDDEGLLVVGPEKSNIIGSVVASKFTIRAEQVFPSTEDSDGTVPLLEWVGDSDKTAGQYIKDNFEADREDPEDVDDRTAAELWLEDYLTANPGVFSDEAKDEARKKARISERTLQRAAKAIGVEFGSQGFPRRTTWTLPDDSRDTQSCHVFETGATGATGATGFDKVKQDAVETLFPQSRQSRHTESNGVTVGTTGATGCQVCGQTIPKTRIKAAAGEPACVGCGQAERKTA